MQKRTCQKNELRHFRWNLGAISFPPNSWPAAELPREKNVDRELQSALASFPDPRGFLREPQFPEGAPNFLGDIRLPSCWIFYSSRGVLLSVFFQLSFEVSDVHSFSLSTALLSCFFLLQNFLHHTIDFLLSGIRISPNFTFQTHFTISFCLLS